MTFKQSIIEYLTSNGMFDSQAVATFEVMEADPANKPMQGRWSESIEGYPPSMIAVLRLAAKRAALAYIDEHIPQAWFRPMFTDNPEAEIARLQQELSTR